MNVKQMKVAVFDRPGRISFTMTRLDLLCLSWNALVAAIRGEIGIAIGTGDLEVIETPRGPTRSGEKVLVEPWPHNPAGGKA